LSPDLRLEREEREECALKDIGSKEISLALIGVVRITKEWDC
jgi:hypothetical protein